MAGIVASGSALLGAVRGFLGGCGFEVGFVALAAGTGCAAGAAEPWAVPELAVVTG